MELFNRMKKDGGYIREIFDFAKLARYGNERTLFDLLE